MSSPAGNTTDHHQATWFTVSHPPPPTAVPYFFMFIFSSWWQNCVIYWSLQLFLLVPYIQSPFHVAFENFPWILWIFYLKSLLKFPTLNLTRSQNVTDNTLLVSTKEKSKQTKVYFNLFLISIINIIISIKKWTGCEFQVIQAISYQVISNKHRAF